MKVLFRPMPIQWSKGVPILGKDWYLYSDESGERVPKQKKECFCIAVVAIPGVKSDFSVEEYKKQIKSGNKARARDLIATKAILDAHKAFICISYFNLFDKKILTKLSQEYKAKKKMSKLSSEQNPSLTNYIWLKAFGLSIIEALMSLSIEQHELGNIFIKHHDITLKNRERKVVENVLLKAMPNKIKEICSQGNRKMGFPFFKVNEIYVSELAGVKDNYLGVKIADQLAGTFRRFNTNNRLAEFENIFDKSQTCISDLTDKM